MAWQEAQTKEMSISHLATSAASSSITQTGISLDDEPNVGSDDAKLTIVMFGDFACPYSRQAAFSVRSLVYQNHEQVKLIYKDFPLTDIHPEAEQASEAAACAGDQDRFWEMFDKIYQNQNNLSQDALIENARNLDLDICKFISCFNNADHQVEIAADYAEGLQLGIYGTPTFFLNGQKVNGAIPTDILRSTIEKFISSSSD